MSFKQPMGWVFMCVMLFYYRQFQHVVSTLLPSRNLLLHTCSHWPMNRGQEVEVVDVAAQLIIRHGELSVMLLSVLRHNSWQRTPVLMCAQVKVKWSKGSIVLLIVPPHHLDILTLKQVIKINNRGVRVLSAVLFIFMNLESYLITEGVTVSDFSD